MPEGHRKMKDFLLYVRADEAKDGEIKSHAGILDQNLDSDQLVSFFEDGTKPHPSQGFTLNLWIG